MLEIMHQNNAFAMFLNPSREFQLPFSLARRDCQIRQIAPAASVPCWVFQCCAKASPPAFWH
jgi:hypothetical protein